MRIYNITVNIFKKLKQDKIFVYSSHASFYILISAIPFITLFILLIKQFPHTNEYEISRVLIPFFPDVSTDTAQKILDEIFHKTSGAFLSFSLVSLLWTSSRGISAVRRGLRVIYGLENPGFIRDVLISIALIFFIIVIVIFLLFLAMLFSVIKSGIIMFLVGLFVLTGIFSLVYFLFSGRKFPFKSHIPGGLSASFSWILFIRIFSFYIRYLANYSSIYGSLTAIFLLVLWIYFSTIIFFLGAEFNIILFSELLKKKRLKKNCL